MWTCVNYSSFQQRQCIDPCHKLSLSYQKGKKVVCTCCATFIMCILLEKFNVFPSFCAFTMYGRYTLNKLYLNMSILQKIQIEEHKKTARKKICNIWCFFGGGSQQQFFFLLLRFCLFICSFFSFKVKIAFDILAQLFSYTVWQPVTWKDFHEYTQWNM